MILDGLVACRSSCARASSSCMRLAYSCSFDGAPADDTPTRFLEASLLVAPTGWPGENEGRTTPADRTSESDRAAGVRGRVKDCGVTGRESDWTPAAPSPSPPRRIADVRLAGGDCGVEWVPVPPFGLVSECWLIAETELSACADACRPRRRVAVSTRVTASRSVRRESMCDLSLFMKSYDRCYKALSRKRYQYDIQRVSS